MRNTLNRFTLAVALVTMLVAVSGPARAGQSASFADLIAGLGPNGDGTLIEGDKVFSDFGLFSSVNSGGADAPDANEVFATTTILGGNIGLILQSAKWNVDAGQTIDTAFSFTVTSNGPLIIDAELAFLSYASDGDAAIHITESLSNGTNLLIDSLGGPLSDHHVFAPIKSLRVNKDVSLEGHTGKASLSTFTQTFSQVVPEPSTFVTGGMALAVGLVAMVRRRSKRS